jgi:hypothetical protein
VVAGVCAFSAPLPALDLTDAAAVLVGAVVVALGLVARVAAIVMEANEAIANKVKIFFMMRPFRFFCQLLGLGVSIQRVP